METKKTQNNRIEHSRPCLIHENHISIFRTKITVFFSSFLQWPILEILYQCQIILFQLRRSPEDLNMQAAIA